MLQVLIGVVVGAMLGALTAIGLDVWRDGRQARRAARLIQMELIEISLIGAGVSDTYPFPLKSAEWIAFRDRLADRLSDEDLVDLSNFYMQNELVERGLIEQPLGSDVSSQAQRVGKVVSRYRRRRGLRHLWRLLRPSGDKRSKPS